MTRLVCPRSAQKCHIFRCHESLCSLIRYSSSFRQSLLSCPFQAPKIHLSETYVKATELRLYNPDRELRAYLDTVPAKNAFVSVNHGVSFLPFVWIGLRDIDR
jgi:hypothetical protein